MDKIKIPVLFIVFNRPHTTRKVFEVIREVKPERLYIAADGPRNKEESGICKEVRNIATNVDWNCEVETLFHDENKGCGSGPVAGISWFFANEEYGVILEDDCVPTRSFFRFCEELLERYKDDERIMHINGNNYGAAKENFFSSDYSYHFGSMPQAWGWASWRRAWQKFDWKINNLDQFINAGFLESIFTEEKYVKKQIKRWELVQGGKRDIWDFQWQFSVISNHGLTIVPKCNLITNIGFGKNATHTKNKNSVKADLKTDQIQFPLNHPDFIVPDRQINSWYQNNMLGSPSILKRVRKKIDLLIKT